MRYVLLVLCLYGLFACQSSPEHAPPAASQLPVIKTAQLNGRQIPTFELRGTTWLAQNLDLESDDSWCYDSRPDNCAQAGRLYRYAAAVQACQQLGEDWQLPGEADFAALAEELGGYYNWLKDESVKDPVLGNTQLQALGFLPGGFRGSGGGFENQGKSGFYWTATALDESQSWMVQLGVAGSKLTFRPANKGMGMSCRCLRYPK